MNPADTPSAAAYRVRGARESSPPKGLFVAVVLYLIITFMRPQDFIPGIEAIRPGLLATLGIMVLWSTHGTRQHLRDAVFKWQIFLLLVMLAGLPIVVNHFHWFWTCIYYIVYIAAFTVGLPAAATNPDFRQAILRWLLLSFLWLALWVNTHGGIGTGGYFRDENDAAAGLIFGGCLAFATFRYSRSQFWRWLGLLTAGLCVVGIVASASRGGFVGLVAAVAAILYFSGRLLKGLVVVALLVLVSLPFVPEEYKSDVQSISDTEDSTRKDRIYSWNRGIDLFRLSPLIGIGAGNFPWRVGDVEWTDEALTERGNRRAIAGRAAHSLYFTILPEGGVLGTMAFAALVILILRRGARVARASSGQYTDESTQIIGLFLCTAIVGYLASGLFISVLWYPQLWLLAGLSVLVSPSARIDERGVISWPSAQGSKAAKHTTRRSARFRPTSWSRRP